VNDTDRYRPRSASCVLAVVLLVDRLDRRRSAVALASGQGATGPPDNAEELVAVRELLRAWLSVRDYLCIPARCRTVPPLYLTVPELAARLRLSRSRIYKLVRAGALPAVRLVPNGKLLFDPVAVDVVLRAQTGIGAAVPEPSRASRRQAAANEP
jgi:excisionase family DNA binding protein